MKKIIIALSFLISIIFAYGQSQRKVAILPVLDKNNSFGGTEGYAKKLMFRMSLHAAISSVDGFIPLDRIDFSAAMNEAAFQRSGSVSDAEIRAIGEQYGATHVLITEMAKIDAERMILSAKITNVQTSASKAALPVIASQDPAKMSEVCMNLAADLLDATNIGGAQHNYVEKSPSTSGMEWTDSRGRKGIYIGELRNGVPHGQGQIKYNEGEKVVQYVGEFVDGKKCGVGIEKYSNGNRYKGEFKDGWRIGKGIMNYSKGGYYDGEWINVREGNGTMYYPDGRRYEGYWDKNKYNNKGTMYYANGNRYEGEWENGARVRGTYYFANGDRYEGEYKDGKRHGFGKFYYANGQYTQGKYLDGKAVGTHHIYSASGEYMGSKEY